jgi:hypothetical protein
MPENKEDKPQTPYRTYGEVLQDARKKIGETFPAAAQSSPDILEKVAMELAEAEWAEQCAYNHSELDEEARLHYHPFVKISWNNAQPVRDQNGMKEDYLFWTDIDRKEIKELIIQLNDALAHGPNGKDESFLLAERQERKDPREVLNKAAKARIREVGLTSPEPAENGYSETPNLQQDHPLY